MLYRINLYTCVSTEIILTLVNQVLVTNRQTQFTFVFMLSSLVSSIFGFLQLFGLGMIITESTEKILRKRIKQHKKLIDVVERREVICKSFEYVKRKLLNKKSSHTKIFPDISTQTDTMNLENDKHILRTN